MLTFKSELETEESGRWNAASHTWRDNDNDGDDGDPIIIFMNIIIIENCTLLGYYTAGMVIPYRRFGTTYRSRNVGQESQLLAA